MWIRLAFTCLVAMLGVAPMEPAAAATRDSVATPSEIGAQVAKLRASALARDSLSALADSATGATREFYDELIAQHDDEVHEGLIALAERIEADRRDGVDVKEAQRLVGDWLREDWPRARRRLEHQLGTIVSLGITIDQLTGAARLATESQISHRSEQLVEAYQSLVDEVLALERVGVDVAERHRFLVQGLPSTARSQVTRVQLAGRARSNALARLSHDAGNAELRFALEAADERLKRTSQTLWAAILLLDRLDLETRDLRVAFITATGKINADVFNWRVLLGVVQAQGIQLLDFLALRAPQWLFQIGLIAVTFIAFRALARLARRTARRAVGYSHVSELMRNTIVGLAGGVVMLVGVVVILTQLGVQIAPLLAGFGVAGVVIGFAMQSTLSNFAAGGMILWNRPFDLGDDIDVAGVSGTVRRMNLVSTTILTGDNQTIVIPNSSIWGGVIRNQTAQPNRRVDLTFGIGYGDDVDKAEHALSQIVAEQVHVLKEPAPVIRLHQLADSSVNFVVRVWTPKQSYWDVYWGITRAVKLSFDQEGITIPAPRREVRLKLGKGPIEQAMAVAGAKES